MSRMLTFDEREQRIEQLKADYASGKLDEHAIPELVDLLDQLQEAQAAQLVVICRYAQPGGTVCDPGIARSAEGLQCNG